MTAVTDDFYLFIEKIYKFLRLNFDSTDNNTATTVQKFNQCISFNNLRFPGSSCCECYVIKIYVDMFVDYVCKETKNSKSSGQNSTLRAMTKQFGKRKTSLPPQTSSRPTRTT